MSILKSKASLVWSTLGGIAKATDFGPQPKPAAFRVPIHTRQ